jgi:hypothetical protein
MVGYTNQNIMPAISGNKVFNLVNHKKGHLSKLIMKFNSADIICYLVNLQEV